MRSFQLSFGISFSFLKYSTYYFHRWDVHKTKVHRLKPCETFVQNDDTQYFAATQFIWHLVLSLALLSFEILPISFSFSHLHILLSSWFPRNLSKNLCFSPLLLLPMLFLLLSRWVSFIDKKLWQQFSQLFLSTYYWFVHPVLDAIMALMRNDNVVKFIVI